MSKRLFVTGAAGFIGSNFVHYWLRTNPDDFVLAYDLLTYAGNLANLDGCKGNPNLPADPEEWNESLNNFIQHCGL